MLTCRACLGRALTTICSPPTLLTVARGLETQRIIRARLAQTFTTTTPTRSLRLQEDPPQAPFPRTGVVDRIEPDSLHHLKSSKRLQWRARKHLEHMKDPYKIAQHVARSLKDVKEEGDERYEETVALVQQASKTRQCPVAWNHLIDFQIQRQRLHAAIKLLNDMKKRDQHPNPQTYTIIFRGCATSRHPNLAASAAVRLHGVLVKDKQVKPNIIHLNSALQACGRAGKLDAMFGLLEWLEDAKLRPTARTFTSILHSMRAAVVQEDTGSEAKSNFDSSENLPRDPDKKQAASSIAETLERSDLVWQEVIRQWRAGSLTVDEDLVCTMGRTLLLGGRERSRDILALLEQTMGLENLVPYSGTSRRSSSSVSSSKFPPPPQGLALAKPGRNTLSMILDVFIKGGQVRRVKPAVRYWKELVSKRGVQPDYDNWRQIFRLLYKARSSFEAASFLAAMPVEHRSQYIFRTAMWTCSRNVDNPNVLANATAIVDAMAQRRLPKVRGGSVEGANLDLDHDLRSLWTYLEIGKARAKPSRDSDKAWTAYCRDVEEVLKRVWEPYYQVSKAAGLSEIVQSRNIGDEGETRHERLVELIAVARAMVSLTSQIAGSVDKKTREMLEKRSSSLNREIVVLDQLGLRMPSWFEKRGEYTSRRDRDGTEQEL